jgi:UDP-N-acetylglucosamine 4,6-dehydratase/5-epimerase
MNKRVLITGACGSVGSALVRSFLDEGSTVCAFDQNEDGLFKLDQEFNDKTQQLRLFLGDVRDKERLLLAMEDVDTVFHCAALKHVYISEYNPFEAMQTNIVGTHNVIQAAISANVDRVVLTSSDKSVNPTSTMGATKLLGERLFTAANNYAGKHKTKFASVRFGNVLNSNGSVLQIFRRQLEKEIPLTITSTEMTRFFLSMPQAVELCIDASKRMVGGEIFVKNMGSCDIMSLAKAVCGGKQFEFTEIGYKPGEKLYEELVTESEVPRTIVDGNMYIVLTDMVDMLSDELRSEYAVYDHLPRLTVPLRSDNSILSETAVVSMLRDADLL